MKSTTRTAGYIVTEEMGGGPCVLLERDNDLWKRLPPGGVLLSDTREVTLFKTRRAARAAIGRTKEYWRCVHNRQQDWPDDAYAIRRLVGGRTP